MPLRTIQEVELFEVSAVTFPAYEDTEIALRSLNDERSSVN
jgi:phage head maturation protease